MTTASAAALALALAAALAACGTGTSEPSPSPARPHGQAPAPQPSGTAGQDASRGGDDGQSGQGDQGGQGDDDGGPGAQSKAAAGPRALPAGTRFGTKTAPAEALTQIRQLAASSNPTAQRQADALRDMVRTPQAIWLNGGGEKQVYDTVHREIRLAKQEGAVAVFVAYDIPGRDCGDYSAGGAKSGAAYAGWIGSLASAIGGDRAVVILEPDSLGNLPTDCRRHPSSLTDGAREAQLKKAVQRLERQPHAAVYLDGGNSAWHSAAKQADRLVKAGVAQAQGFFLNVSNFQTTASNAAYGTALSAAVAKRTGGRAPHFVIDTSRNGAGPAKTTGWGAKYRQASSALATLKAGTWCNPPSARLGAKPKAQPDARHPLLDAYLWVKTPGRSDGQCDAAGGARAWDFSAFSKAGWPADAATRRRFDPLWGRVDPPAGAWFPQQALALVATR